jgi:hypothetical protein
VSIGSLGSSLATQGVTLEPQVATGKVVHFCVLCRLRRNEPSTQCILQWCSSFTSVTARHTIFRQPTRPAHC